VVSGEFEYLADDAATPVDPGQVLCIPPDERHTFRRRPGAGRGVISCIHCELLPGASWRAGDYRLRPEPGLVTDAGGDPAVEERFRRCAAVFSGYGHYRAEMLETVAREVWLGLAERWTGAPAPALSSRTRRMVDWLRARLAEPVSRRDLAAAFFLTPEHVNALFRKELGISPTQFLHRERVLLAHRLMQSEGLSAKEAAARAGFCDQFYFSKVFRKVMGVPPSRA
jgi:AraC-like DNA-binding protein